MKRYISTLLLFCCLSVSVLSQPGHDLVNAMIGSLKSNNFKLLEPNLPTEAVVRKMYPSELGNKSSGEIKKLLAGSKTRLEEGWKMIAGNVKEKNIDLSKLNITEVFIYKPFPGKDMTMLIAAYEYEGKKYEDFNMVVGVSEGKTYLMEFPVTTRMLTLHEGGRSELEEAKRSIRLSGPEMTTRMQDRVNALIEAIDADTPADFGKLCVYRGDDDFRKWKETVNTDSETDMEWPNKTRERLKGQLESCGKWSFGKFFSESESEGTWLIQPVICAAGTIHFAFLEIGGELLLGDIDVE